MVVVDDVVVVMSRRSTNSTVTSVPVVSIAFETWPRYDDARQSLMRAELERIAGTEGLSKDVTEIVTRILAA